MLNPEKSRNYRIISSPIIAGGLIIAPTRVNTLVALRPGGSGDIAATHVAWTFHRGPDVPSPVSDGTYLYLVSEQGVVYCLELKTGTLVYGPERIPNDFYSSSPVLEDGKNTSRRVERVTTVFRDGPKFEIWPEHVRDTARLLPGVGRVSQGQLFVENGSELWCRPRRKDRPTLRSAGVGGLTANPHPSRRQKALVTRRAHRGGRAAPFAANHEYAPGARHVRETWRPREGWRQRCQGKTCSALSSQPDVALCTCSK